ncbi:MAG: hypothetical protein HY303_06770 [Candidatus Wallbacteria bacterium]|nr:hypothetical protein [Candidatus Wallbacteria bacterium]
MTARTKKLILVALALALAGVVVVAVALFWGLSKIQDPALISQTIQNALGPAFPVKIEIKTVVYEPFWTVHVMGIEATHKGFPEKPLIKCGKLSFTIKPSALSTARLAISQLTISDWQINVLRNPDGSMNLPAMPFRSAALRLPELGQAMLASAGMMAAKQFSIDSIELEKGQIVFEDRGTTQTANLSGVVGQLSFDDGHLRFPTISAKLFDSMPVGVSGQLDVLPALALEAAISIHDIDARVLQERINILNGLKLIGTPWAGALPTKIRVKAGPAGTETTIELQFQDVTVCEPMLTRQTVSVKNGTGKIVVKPGQPGAPAGTVDMQLQHVTVLPLDPGVTFPFDNLTLGIDFAGQQITIRTCEGHVGGGAVNVKGTLQGIFGELEVSGSGIALNPMLQKTTVMQDHPWASGAMLKKVSGKYSPGQFTFTELEAMLGLATITASGAVRAASAGYEPAGVNGTAEIDGVTLGRLFGFADPSRVGGKASIKFTLQPQSFTSEFRTSDFSIHGGHPELSFHALAAAFNGLRQTKEGQMQVAWSANARSGPFTMLWPQLLKAANLPVNGPVKFDKGDASLMYDSQGLHVMSMNCTSPQVALSGKMLLAPGGALSGALDLEAYSAPGVVAVKNSSVLSGTLKAPQLTPQ